MRSIGIFGGTFDPPHSGHIDVAKAAADNFSLSEVWWTPVGRQPLKPTPPQAFYSQRLAMVRMVCKADYRFVASGADAPRGDGQPNFTIDLLQSLRGEHPGCSWWNIVGADSFLDLPRWKYPDQLLNFAQWIVVSRPGFDLARIEAMGLTSTQRSRVHLLTDIEEPISATDLRDALKRGEQPKAVPPPVLRYIEENGLYR